MKQKILITTPKLNTPGGVSSYWNAILPELKKIGEAEIATVSIGGHGKNILGPIQDQLKFKKAIGIKRDLVVLNPSLGSRSFFRDGFFAKQLVKKGIRFAVFFHGWELPFEKKVTKNHKGFFLNTFGRAEIIFVLSNDFKRKIEEWGYTGKVVLETTNVNINLLSNYYYEDRSKMNSDPKGKKILFLSRLIREKGVFELIDAFNELRKKHAGLQLVIAGDGKDLNEVATRVGDDAQIEVTGHVEGEAKIKLFKESQIYCLPSRYGEGLPTTVLEAMAFGMPVITTAAGGLREFFKNYEMGFVVNLEERRDLEEKLDRILTDTELANTIGKFNYDYARENLISTVVTQRLFRYLKDCMGQNPIKI